MGRGLVLVRGRVVGCVGVVLWRVWSCGCDGEDVCVWVCECMYSVCVCV